MSTPFPGPISRLLAGRDGAIWLEEGDRSLCRREARLRISALARGYLQQGLRSGDRAGWRPWPDVSSLLAGLALIEAGAAIALLPLRETEARINEESSRLGLRLVLGQDPAQRATPDWIQAKNRNLIRGDRVAIAPCSRVLVRSSGSSGSPRWICHRLDGLLHSARTAVRHLGVTGADVWLISLPLDHVGGLGILLRSLLSGCRLGFPGDRGVAPALMQGAPSLLSLVPTQLFDLVQSGLRPPLSLRVALLGGAPLPDSLAHAAGTLGWPLLTSYGATETGSLVCCRDAAQVQELTVPPGETGRPLTPHRLRLDQDGCVEVASPALFEGELDDAGALVPRCGDWWPSGDLAEWRQGGLVLLGRRDNLIISGGEKIRAEEVEEALLGIAGVVRAVVVPLPDARLGTRPAAFVDWQGDTPPNSTGWRRLLEAKLARHKHPVRVWPWPDGIDTGWKVPRETLRQQALELLSKESG